MIITSIYVTETGSAVCSMRLSNSLAMPSQVWESSPNDQDVLSAALNHDWRTELFLVNPGKNPVDPSESITAHYLKKAGKRVKVSPSFRISEGVAVYYNLAKEGRVLPGCFPEWAVLTKQLERITKAEVPIVMAFLQAVVEVEKRSRFSQDYLLGATVSGVQSAENGFYVPVSSWGNGTL